jgi:diguanylate cyclase (GGDEF)-like protein/PAS domain S-box-containing protein
MARTKIHMMSMNVRLRGRQQKQTGVSAQRTIPIRYASRMDILMPQRASPPQSAQQSLLAKALASTASAIFITDSAGRIVWINEAFSRLSGYGPEDAIGRTPAILQSGKQNHAFYSQLWETLLEGKVWQGEAIDQRKDGSLYTVDEIITPLFDEQGDITHFIAIQHDITRQKQDSAKEHHLAYHDALTDLPNRTHFLHLQRQAILHAQHTQHMLATLFLDLDRFKPVNDDFGHHVGDLLLSAVADRLRAVLRQSDAIARFGGDEFAILLTDLPDTEAAVALARKLLDAFGRPFMLRGQRIEISASIGIAIYPTDGEDPEVLLTNADKAMYHAKCRGGNNYQMYSAVISTLH